MAAGVHEDRVAVASTGVIGVQLPMDGVRGRARRARRARARTGTPRSGARSRRPTRSRSARARGRAAGRDGAAERAGQGRGHDPAGLRHDAVLRADRRGARAPRPPTCCSASASSARSTASRSTASCRPTTPRSCWPRARAASSSQPESEDELRLRRGARRALRQLALQIVRDGEGAAPGRPRARPRRPRADRRARRARDRQLAAGQDRAVRRRPQLGPDRAGDRRRAAGHRAAALDIAIEGVQVCARRAVAHRRTTPPARVAATRSSTSSACPARAPRPRSSSPTSRTSTSRINAEYTT